MQHSLKIDYDDDVLFSAGMSRADFNREARFILAAKLYELARLSSGQAARLCGMERVEFLLSLGRIGVSMTNLQSEDAVDEVAFLQDG